MNAKTSKRRGYKNSAHMKSVLQTKMKGNGEWALDLSWNNGINNSEYRQLELKKKKKKHDN